jgi:hemoglobin
MSHETLFEHARVRSPDRRPPVRSHVEFGTQVAMQNSNATTDDDLHPLRGVPTWTWDGG